MCQLIHYMAKSIETLCGLGRFSSFGQCTLVPKKGNIKALGYNDILDNSEIPASRQQFVFGPFLF